MDQGSPLLSPSCVTEACKINVTFSPARSTRVECRRFTSSFSTLSHQSRSFSQAGLAGGSAVDLFFSPNHGDGGQEREEGRFSRSTAARRRRCPFDWNQIDHFKSVRPLRSSSSPLPPSPSFSVGNYHHCTAPPPRPTRCCSCSPSPLGGYRYRCQMVKLKTRSIS